MKSYEDLSEEEKILYREIENSIKESLSKTPVFPITATFEDDGVKATVTFEKPKEDGTIEVTVNREYKTLYITGTLE